MNDKLAALSSQANTELGSAVTLDAVEQVRVKFLGKKGELAQILSGMGKLAPDERRALGEKANALKAELETKISAALTRVQELALEQELKGPRLDVTLPGRGVRPGRRHPVSQTLEDICSTFARLGFVVEQGPEIELDWYNFEALNVPADHPARDMQDTFYVNGGTLHAGFSHTKPVVLRTHTSPVQIRTMLSQKPPVRAVMPGRVYRKDSDQTHTPMFHQVEGLLVDEKVTFAELKGTLDAFARAFFGAKSKTRFRPSFFPFTEPSAEVDVSCVFCGGSGCRVCKQTGWLEVLGSGMVHPNVFRHAGYDPSKVTGFAFGMGVERLAMLRYGIDDLRTMFENDYRFVAQF
ncbi:MAG: phenylalanine--tRNA ligase subunit alpha [Myxococcaceae bacterium]